MREEKNLNNKIAIMVDSAGDISPEKASEMGIYLLPLWINYKGESYQDGHIDDITKFYSELEQEMPKTSTPSIGEINELFEKIKNDGFESCIVINISSALSGVHNSVKIAASDFEGLKIETIDSKNIGIATGFLSLYAMQLVNEGQSFEHIVEKLREKVKESKVFFSVKTLKYLIEGGRIGKVSGKIGELLKIKPIISCDVDGVYYTVERHRGEKKSRARMVEMIRELANKSSKYYIAICDGYAKDEIKEVKESIHDLIQNAEYFSEGQITSTLSIHTGPGLVGVGFFPID